MNAKIRVGQTGEIRFKVEAQHVIDFDGMPPVLATPRLVQFLEQAGREALKPCLSPEESSVGMDIELQHLAPTPLGALVTCKARVIHVDERAIQFQIEAADEMEVIARGLHKRAIVNILRFAKRVQRKASKPA